MIRIEGLSELRRRIDKDSEMVSREMAKIVFLTALDVQRRARESIQGGRKSGTIYQKYNPRRLHQASAAGEAPASDTGRLAGSIQIKRYGTSPRADVDVKAKYGYRLEYNQKRPFMRPALEASLPKLDSRLTTLANRVRTDA